MSHETFGLITAVPGLPDGLAETYRDTFVTIDGIRLHAVIGGHGDRCWSSAAGPSSGTNGA